MDGKFKKRERNFHFPIWKISCIQNTPLSELYLIMQITRIKTIL